jgi:steroid delta-isomerase-like uncharacterized protein
MKIASTHYNKDLVLRFFTEVWNGRRMESLDSLLRFPYEIENLLTGSPPQHLNREEMELHIQEWFRAFPDLDVTLRKIIAEGDKVFVETRYAGTHLGNYRGIETTGKRIGVSVLAIFKFASGKLAGHAVMVDALGLYRQLGKIDLEQLNS